MTAAYESAGDSAALTQIGDAMARQLTETWTEPVQRLGLATAEAVARMAAAWREFLRQPGAFFASAWCQAVARK